MVTTVALWVKRPRVLFQLLPNVFSLLRSKVVGKNREPADLKRLKLSLGLKKIPLPGSL